MNEHANFLERISAVYTAAFHLNDNPDLEGAPCSAVFKVARQLLTERFGANVGARIDWTVLDCHEYSPEYLAEYLAEHLAAADALLPQCEQDALKREDGDDAPHSIKNVLFGD